MGEGVGNIQCRSGFIKKFTTQVIHRQEEELECRVDLNGLATISKALATNVDVGVRQSRGDASGNKKG